MSNKPEQVFKVGPVRAAIFQNEIVVNGNNVSLSKVVIEVRYKDKNGEWKGTNSLSINDIPKAILALQKAYDYITTRPRTDDAPGEARDRIPSAVVGSI